MSLVLVIATPEENATSFVTLLNRLAHYDWQNRNEILVVELPKGASPKKNAAFLCEKIQDKECSGQLTVLIPSRVHVTDIFLTDAGYSVIKGSSISNMLHKDGLSKELKKFGLSWLLSVQKNIGMYSLANISETDINSWLNQFERLGNHRPVGEHLLKLFEMISHPDLVDSLSRNANFSESKPIFAFNEDHYGKSWGTVSNLVGKSCGGVTILPSNLAIEQCNENTQVWLVEDGLFSGTETRAVMDSLMNKRGTKTQKVEALTDVTKIKSTDIVLRYGAICDFGEASLKRYLRQNDLLNIHIDKTASAKMFKVLINDSADLQKEQSAISHDKDDDTNFFNSLRQKVMPYAFQSDRGWRDDALRLRAQEFCEGIGFQLWQSYLKQKKFDLGRWPQDKQKRCSLGMEGLGLVFSFPHSVPKASLPLLWAQGEVTHNNVSIQWQPLLTNANS